MLVDQLLHPLDYCGLQWRLVYLAPACLFLGLSSVWLSGLFLELVFKESLALTIVAG